MKGGVDRWSTKRLLVFVENGYEPMTKAVPAADGSCIAGLKVCPVCVELDPSATNMPLLRKMPPKLLSSNDLMASTPTSLSCDTYTHRHTNKHTHTHTPHSNSQTQCGSAVLLESHSDKHPTQVSTLSCPSVLPGHGTHTLDYTCLGLDNCHWSKPPANVSQDMSTMATPSHSGTFNVYAPRAACSGTL